MTQTRSRNTTIRGRHQDPYCGSMPVALATKQTSCRIYSSSSLLFLQALNVRLTRICTHREVRQAKYASGTCTCCALNSNVCISCCAQNGSRLYPSYLALQQVAFCTLHTSATYQNRHDRTILLIRSLPGFAIHRLHRAQGRWQMSGQSEYRQLRNKYAHAPTP